jgi:hypothetical protein
VTLGLGEEVTCTFVNDDIAPTLKLVKTVTNDDGGTAVADDWSLSASAAFPNNDRNFSNTGGSGTFVTVLANAEYSLLESTVAGYAAGSWSCDGGAQVGSTITLGLDEDVTCTINNDDIAPTLKLVKTVTNDDGGTAVADDWTLSATAAAPDDGRNFSNAGGSGVFETVFANARYDLAESTVAGYTAGSWSCNGFSLKDGTIELGLDQDVTCTINNDDIPPRLTVIKKVINNSGGRLEASDFTVFVTGSATLGSLSFPGVEDPGLTLILKAGTFDVSETDEFAQFYMATYSGDCSGTLYVGDEKTCTITNDDIRRKNQASIQIERLDYSISDSNANGRGDQIQGSLDISNESEMPLTILIDEIDFDVEVRQGKKWKSIDATCTTDPDAPFVWDAGLPDLLTVNFECTGVTPEIRSGTVVRVTANVYIFGRRKAFSYKTSLTY